MALQHSTYNVLSPKLFQLSIQNVYDIVKWMRSRAGLAINSKIEQVSEFCTGTKFEYKFQRQPIPRTLCDVSVQIYQSEHIDYKIRFRIFRMFHDKWCYWLCLWVENELMKWSLANQRQSLNHTVWEIDLKALPTNLHFDNSSELKTDPRLATYQIGSDSPVDHHCSCRDSFST